MVLAYSRLSNAGKLKPDGAAGSMGFSTGFSKGTGSGGGLMGAVGGVEVFADFVGFDALTVRFSGEGGFIGSCAASTSLGCFICPSIFASCAGTEAEAEGTPGPSEVWLEKSR